MKRLFLFTLVTICVNSAYSQFEQEYPAFDKTVNIQMDARKKQDLGVMLNVGITGRRLPLSLLVGVNLQEFDNLVQSKTDSTKYLSTTGYNATMMLRLININWRDCDLNVYGTVYKNHDYIYESGIKAGIMLNGRNRMYLILADMKNNYYNSFKAGVSFSLFFWNGYSAY